MQQFKRSFRVALIWIMSLSASSAVVQAQGSGDPYADFSVFVTRYIGAEKEELVYATFGNDLIFVEKGDWVYASDHSASIGFQTNLPADAIVEYGLTPRLGLKSESDDRKYYTHLRHLRGLETGKTYHYRLVATDERGRRIESPVRTFVTKLPASTRVIRIPQDMQGQPPYTLDQSGAYYLLTQDLQAEGTAFDIPQKTSNITIDLGGHTVTYNTKAWPDLEMDNFPDWIRDAKYGVRVMKSPNLKVYNGSIVQGVGNNRAQTSSIGYSPMYISGTNNTEIAGVVIDYSGSQIVGIYNHYGANNASFHHNVFIDRGTQTINRHGVGSRAMAFYNPSNTLIHNNLVKRTRQSGFEGTTVHDNEVYIDSWATNSFGIKLHKDGVAYNNKVFGTGYHVVAFGWGNGLTYHHNFIHLEGESFKGRFSEFGEQVSLNGFRLTQYDGSKKPWENNLYHDNVIVIRGREDSQGRGTQFWSNPHVKNLHFRDNIIKALGDDAKTARVTPVVIHGSASNADTHEPVIYSDNELQGNIANVRFGDDYGVGSKTLFINCTFTRVGNDSRYHTFMFDRVRGISKGHVIRDAIYKNGASMDSIRFSHRENQDITFEHTIHFEATPDSVVVITDATGKEVFNGVIDDQGKLAVPLAQVIVTPNGKTMLTPHQVRVTAQGKPARSISVQADRSRTVKVPG